MNNPESLENAFQEGNENENETEDATGGYKKANPLFHGLSFSGCNRKDWDSLSEFSSVLKVDRE